MESKISKKEIKKRFNECFKGCRYFVKSDKNGDLFGSLYWRGFYYLDATQRNRIFSEKVRDFFGLNGLNIRIFMLHSDELEAETFCEGEEYDKEYLEKIKCENEEVKKMKESILSKLTEEELELIELELSQNCISYRKGNIINA